MVLGLLISENLLNAHSRAFNTRAASWQDYQSWASVNTSISKYISFSLELRFARKKRHGSISMIKPDFRAPQFVLQELHNMCFESPPSLISS